LFTHSITDSNDNQLGFKKGIGRPHAIYAVRTVTDRWISQGFTVNLCAIDLSKAFDKVNHHALFIKLMKRNIPVQLLKTFSPVVLLASSGLTHGLLSL